MTVSSVHNLMTRTALSWWFVLVQGVRFSPMGGTQENVPKEVPQGSVQKVHDKSRWLIRRLIVPPFFSNVQKTSKLKSTDQQREASIGPQTGQCTFQDRDAALLKRFIPQ